MNSEEFKKASEYWTIIDAESAKMPADALLKEMESYINANDTCALATSIDSFIRCTPIEYTYMNRTFYIFTEGGQKFKALAHNKNVSIAIFDKFAGFGKLKGMQITGTAEVLEAYGAEYMDVAAFKGLNVKALQKAKHHLHLLKITPSSIEFTNADFKKLGYSVRQALNF